MGRKYHRRRTPARASAFYKRPAPMFRRTCKITIKDDFIKIWEFVVKTGFLPVIEKCRCGANVKYALLFSNDYRLIETLKADDFIISDANDNLRCRHCSFIQNVSDIRQKINFAHTYLLRRAQEKYI